MNNNNNNNSNNGYNVSTTQSYQMNMIPGSIIPTVIIGAPQLMHHHHPPHHQLHHPHHPIVPNVMPLPFVPPNWQQRLLPTPATQPLTLYIGKIPPELDNDFLLKILETCGNVQKWNRPEDLNTRTLKSFGFVTYAQGTGALRCRNVIGGLQICGGTLLVKAGTKELSSLVTIATSERLPPPQIDPYTRIPIPQQEIDTNALYDAPLRELIYKLIEKKYNQNNSEELESEIAALEAKTKGIRRSEEVEDESSLDHEKRILREIEKFRERQAKRDRELEQKRNERILVKLREIEDQQKAIEEANLTAEAQFISSQLNSKENQTDTPLDQLPQNNKRELETEEELEMKKKRRQEGLAMVNGEDSSINLDSLDDNNNNNSQSISTSQNLPEISGDITETGREQTLANLAASISNKAIGGKLTLKNNTKNAPKKAAFGAVDDESETKTHRQLIPLDYTEEEQRSLHLTTEQHAAQFLQKMERTNSSNNSIPLNNTSSASNSAPGLNSTSSVTVDVETAKKLKLKEIVDKIPTARDQLFAYQIDWNACEKHNVIESSIRSWVVKKFIEYLGEEEVSLTNFILKKISQRCNPQELLSELEPVLDQDAESFVLKLWRLLIFNVIKADIDSGGDGQGGYKNN